MCDLPIICEKMSLDSDSTRSIDFEPPTLFLVKDFGWPIHSPRYIGDHTQESNPDWNHDPMDCTEARAEAMRKMEVSYALYMANLSKKTTAAKKPTSKEKDGWTRFVMPWRWTARREVAAI
jgi:hypothetical protein